MMPSQSIRMRKFTALFAAAIFTITFFSVAHAATINQNTDGTNVDLLTEICKYSQIFFPPCALWNNLVDTTNKMTADGLQAALDQANSVQDLQIQVLTNEQTLAESRVNLTWQNIESLFVLVLEVVKTAFYLLSIIMFLYVPYLFLKVLVWFQETVIKKYGGSKKGNKQ